MTLDALSNVTECNDDVSSVPGMEYSFVKLSELAQYEKDATVGSFVSI
jgi:hypothetical protein